MTRARDVANLIGSGNYSSTTFTATAGQTAFTISHTQGFIQVFMNGLLLDETADYTSNGSAVTLTSGAAAGDEIEVVAYNTFSVGDALNQAAADTRYVNTTGDTMTGNLGVNVSPTAALDVRRSDADGKIAEFHQNAGYGFEVSSSQTVATMGSGYLQALSVTTNAGSGAVEQMRISKEGRVTKPNQPSFYAYTSSDYTATGNLIGGSKWSERWDVGNNFSDGTFTAPVGGKYYFEVMWDANSIQSTIDIQVNTTAVIRWEPTGRTDSTWETHTYSALLNLAANDSVRLYGNMHSQSSSYPFHMGGSGQWGHFAGFLIG